MSTKIESLNYIAIKEINGVEYSGVPNYGLLVREHWNRKALVVIEIDGAKYTVLAADLKRAIDNAQNAHSN